MTKDVGILILGLLVAAMPYLGFTATQERLILVVMGLSIAVLAFLIRGDISFFSIERNGGTFVENAPDRKSVGDGIVTEGTDMNHEERKEENEQ